MIVPTWTPPPVWSPSAAREYLRSVLREFLVGDAGAFRHRAQGVSDILIGHIWGCAFDSSEEFNKLLRILQ
jgi:hypothetical protein